MLSLAIVVIARANLSIQKELQLRQQQLSGSVLTPQAQQIANSVLQDMASVAAKNDKMRTLLGKHGFTLPAAQPPPAVGPVKKQGQEEK